MLLRMLKLLLVCMLPSCFRFTVLVVTDLRRAVGEHMRKRACVHVLWVACVREFAGDSAATGVRHFAGIKDFFSPLQKDSTPPTPVRPRRWTTHRTGQQP